MKRFYYIIFTKNRYVTKSKNIHNVQIYGKTVFIFEYNSSCAIDIYRVLNIRAPIIIIIRSEVGKT